MGKVKWEAWGWEEKGIYAGIYWWYGYESIAENREEMRSMIDKLERYLKRKGLELNTKKKRSWEKKIEGGKSANNNRGRKEFRWKNLSI